MEELPKPKVGDVWWRYEDRSWSVADEYGEHAYTTHSIGEVKLFVVGITPCGVWLANSWNKNIDVKLLHAGQSKTLVLDHYNKKFGCPTKKLALESYIARKTRQERIYQARLSTTQLYMKMANERLADIIEEDHANE